MEANEIYAELLRLRTLTGNYSFREQSHHARWWEEPEYTNAKARIAELKAELDKLGLPHHQPGVSAQE